MDRREALRSLGALIVAPVVGLSVAQAEPVFHDYAYGHYQGVVGTVFVELKQKIRKDSWIGFQTKNLTCKMQALCISDFLKKTIRDFPKARTVHLRLPGLIPITWMKRTFDNDNNWVMFCGTFDAGFSVTNVDELKPFVPIWYEVDQKPEWKSVSKVTV